MTTVGFIGLGIMGGPMAANLVHAGFDVVGFNRTATKTEELVRAGGRAAGSVGEAARGAAIVATMLPDSSDVAEVVLGEGGVLADIADGALWIDFSTIRPDVARTAAHACAERGVRALDAPVSGGESGAIDATLSIMVGGHTEDVEIARPVLDAVGSTVVHVGPHGSGQTVKAANQLIVAGNIGLLAEAIVFLEAHDVDPRTALRVLAGGTAGSAVLDRKSEAMITREFDPGFRAELHHKDLGIVSAAAREAGVAIPLGSAVAQLMASLTARGAGHLDHGALISVIEQLSGRSR